MINPVVFQGNAVDSQGNVLSGATISVISVTTGLPVLLYSDLAETGMTNPFNTNASGAFVFYCEAETVNITATKGASSRTWENQFLNVVSLKNDLKTNPQTVSAPWTFEVPTYMESPLNMSSGIPISFGSVSVLNGTYNSIPTLKVNNVELLTKNTLSSANNIVDTDRAVNNLGWWAIAQENLGTAAFLDAGINSGDVTIQTKGTWTPTLASSYGTTITEGASVVASGTWKIVGDEAFVDFFIDFDDAGSAPVVGDRVIIDGMPSQLAPVAPDGVFSAGSANLYSSIASGNNAVFDCAVTENFSDDAIYLTCLQTLGTTNYSMTLGGRVVYKIR